MDTSQFGEIDLRELLRNADDETKKILAQVVSEGALLLQITDPASVMTICGNCPELIPESGKRRLVYRDPRLGHLRALYVCPRCYDQATAKNRELLRAEG